jgi:hypothetical protein
MILLVIHLPIFPVHHLRLLPFSLALRSSDKISFPLSERVSSSRDPFVFRVGFSLSPFFRIPIEEKNKS